MDKKSSSSDPQNHPHVYCHSSEYTPSPCNYYLSLLSLTTRTLFSLICPTATQKASSHRNCIHPSKFPLFQSSCLGHKILEMLVICRCGPYLGRQVLGVIWSGVRLDAALRHGDFGSPFGRFSVVLSSMATSIFGPDSAWMVVAFLALDLRTVWALGLLISELNVQRSYRGPTGRQMTGHLFRISISGGAEFRSRPTNLTISDEQVVYLFLKLGGQPRL